MKRLWLSLGILLTLFGLSLANIRCTTQASNQLVTLLNQAEEAAEGGDWRSATTLTRQAQEMWDGYAGLLYITSCHAHADAVTTGFREVLELLQQEAEEEYSADYEKKNKCLKSLRSRCGTVSGFAKGKGPWTRT